MVWEVVGEGEERRWETMLVRKEGVNLGGLGLVVAWRIRWVVYLRRDCLLMWGRELVRI